MTGCEDDICKRTRRMVVCKAALREDDMDDKLNSVDSQYLLIQVLKHLEPEELSALIDKMNREKEMDAALKEYIWLCISFADQVRRDSSYCGTLDMACKVIYQRQSSSKGAGEENAKKIRKIDYLKAFGWSNGVQMNRIQRGEAQMKPDNILRFCGGFQKELDRRFWKNQLLQFFPDTFDVDCDGNLEYEGLCLVISYLPDKTRKTIGESLPGSEAKRVSLIFDQIAHKNALSRLGEPPYRLYKVIHHLVQKAPGMTVQILVEDELQTTLVSWYEWKVNWEKAEEVNFEYVPAPRLQRRHILLIAVVFGLSYLEAVILLQTAGYRMSPGIRDEKVLQYFLYKEGAAEAIKEELRGNINLSVS